MNKLFTFLIFSIIFSECFAQDLNYLTSIKPLVPVSSPSELDNLSPVQKNESIQICSETGKIMQSSQTNVSSEHSYVVKQFEYDDNFRLIKEYIPVVSNSGLSYISNFDDLCSQFYSGTNGIAENNSPFSELIYESYPSNTVLEASSEGLDWSIGNGHTNIFNKRLSTLGDNVLNFDYISNQLSLKESYVPSADGQQTVSIYFNNINNFAYPIYIGPLFFGDQYIEYSGGNQFENENSKIIFNINLNQSQYYKLKMKVRIAPGSGAILASLWGNNGLEILPILDEAGESIYLNSWDLNSEWIYIETSLISGLNEIFLKAAGPTGTISDIIEIGEIEVIAFNTVEINRYCESGSFLVEESIDSDGNRIEIFYNVFGQSILERKWGQGAEHLDVYNVYDNNGHLRCVLSPEAINNIELSQTNDFGMIEDLCFYYSYDGRGRVTEKKAPGKGTEHLVYDNANNLVLYQDDVLRSNGKWRFSKFDYFNRNVLNGVYSTSETRENMQNEWFPLGTQYQNFEKRNTNMMNQYSNNAFPTENLEILSISYFDTYPIISSDLNSTGNFSSNTLGLQLANVTKVIKDVNTVNSSLWTVQYFDKYHRVQESVEQGLEGLLCRRNYSYEWNGDLLEEYVKYSNTPIGDITEIYTYSYYRPGVIRGCDYSINNQPTVILFRNEYDVTGEMSKLKLFRDNNQSSNFLQVIDYSYNEKGWLKRINNSSLFIDEFNNDADDVFGQEIFYNEPEIGADLYYEPKFNGNISATKWKTKASNIDATIVNENLYTFQYDSYSRLLRSYYSENTLTNSFEFTENIGDFDEITGYDANGNITSLSRFHSGEIMDELIYSYESLSNKLISVSEAADISLYTNKKHFIPCAEEIQYDYDVNGNLVRDNNKGIQFEYNYLNLIGRVQRTDDLGEAVLTNGNGQFDSKVHFYYDASGKKLYKKTPTDEKYYFGKLEFSNDQDIVLYIPNGRVRLSAESNNEFVYDFFITDYLGNVRAIISNENAQVDQVVLTMEVNRIEEEEDDFYNVSPARVTRPITMPNDNTYGYNSKSAELTSSKDAGQGPGRMIPVKQGDLIDLSTKYWFEDLAMEDNRLTIAQIVQSLALSLISSGGDVVDNIESLTNAYTNSQSMEYLALSNLVAEMFEDVDLSKPQAFMIYLSLNEKFVASKSPYSGFIQVTEANQLGVLVRDQLTMPLNGYFHVFLVNASSKPVNFDNMTVNVIKANVLQQMDYYPYGLMYQKQDVNATNNLLWHHGKELQENEFAQQGKSMDLEDFGARMYDPVVARWWSLDPMAEKRSWVTPYNFVQNNPITRIDPNGMLDDWVGEINEEGSVSWTWDEDIHSVEEAQASEKYAGKDVVSVKKAHVYNSGPLDENGEHTMTTFLRPDGKFVEFDRMSSSGENTAVNSYMSQRGGQIDWLKGISAGFQVTDAFGVISEAGADITKEYQKNQQLMNKLSSPTSLKAASFFSASSKFFGTLGYFGAVYGIRTDYVSMQTGQMSGARFSYNTFGTAASIGVGARVGGLPGAGVGASFYGAQKFYDGYNWWAGEMSSYLTNFENGLSGGWVPR